MSENQEANLLATWLANEPGNPAPSGIDSEVMETIYALRPEYAPPHGLTIDEVLTVLMDGPLMDPVVAEALRTWLTSAPGTPPPDILPIGIVEATYALQPDRAPALRLGIEDVLGVVKEGPLATQTVVDLNAEREARKWWASPALGAVAVAAIALFFVSPMAHKADQPALVHPQLPHAPEAKAREVKTETIPVEFTETIARDEVEDAVEGGVAIAEEQMMPEAAPNTYISKPKPSSRSAVASAPPAELAPPPPAAAIASRSAPDISELAREPDPQALEDTQPTRRRSRSRRMDAFADEQVGGVADSAMAAGTAVSGEPQMEMAEEDVSPPNEPEQAKPLRLNPHIAALEAQAEAAIGAGQLDIALEAIDAALKLPDLNRFDTARLWRKKARILADLGRETDAQHARETAAKLDPTR